MVRKIDLRPSVSDGSGALRRTWLAATTAGARRRRRPSTTAETPGSVQRWPPPPRGLNCRRERRRKAPSPCKTIARCSKSLPKSMIGSIPCPNINLETLLSAIGLPITFFYGRCGLGIITRFTRLLLCLSLSLTSATRD